MSSMQFNYYADAKGEEIIRQELFNRFNPLYAVDYFGKKKNIIKEKEEFLKMPPFEEVYLTCEKLVPQITTFSGISSISIYDSPVIEYCPSKIRDGNIFLDGRLAYFGANEFPEFKKDVQSLFRKLKRHCWKDKDWKVWIFETIGDEATIFIPNRVVYIKK